MGARGSSIIDYIIMNEKAKEKVMKFVEKRIESDHTAISLERKLVTNRNSITEEKEDKRKENVTKQILSWTEEDREIYKAQTEVAMETDEIEESIEEKWKQINAWIKKSVRTKEVKKKRWKIDQKRWWYRSCFRKRKVKAALNKWRKGKNI